MKRSVAEEVARTAYDLSAPELAWNQSLAEALLPALDGGRGVFWLTYAFKDKGVTLGQFGGTSPYKLEELVSRGLGRLTPSAMSKCIRTTAVIRASSVMDDGNMSFVQRVLGKGADCFGLAAPDGTDRGLGFGATHWGGLHIAPRQRQSLERLMQHVGAGLRLRRSLCNVSDSRAAAKQGLNGSPSLAQSGSDNEGIEMRFSAEGRCVDAQGLGKETSLRDKVREHVLQREKRSSQGRLHDNLWDALIEGRWSLVDRFESDGKRFVVAYRNPSGILDPRRCTQEERDVLKHACRGLSYNETAALTGVKASTVRLHVSDAVRKLGVESRVQLPMFYRDANQRSLPLTIDSDLNVTESVEDLGALARMLSAAERQVGKLVASGSSNANIAASRKTSTRTVANQLASIFEKLGVKSRMELAAKLMNDSDAESKLDSERLS